MRYLIVFACLALIAASANADLSSLKVKSTNGISCEACKFIANEFTEWLSANSTSEQVLQDLTAVCKELPSSLFNTCSKLANDIAVAIPKLALALKFEDLTPQTLCGLFGYCNIPCCVSVKPEQVHLSLTHDPSEMVVSWVTPNNDSTVVTYGLSASSLPLVAPGRTITYSAGGWAGFIHYATLTGLKPSSTYYYAVGSNAIGFTDVYHFETRPASGAYPIDWVVIGDMGADPQALNTISRVSALASPNTVGGILHIGDIGYQDGVQHRWDLYMRMIQTMSGYLPYMTIPGNHEIAIQHYLHLEGYKYRFQMPVVPHNYSKDMQGDYFWSMDMGLVHFVGLDTEHPADIPYISDAQLAWLKQDLAAANANRANVPWIVVSGHRPLWCSSHRSDCTTLAAEMRMFIENILYTNKVDLVLAGHCHNYERTYPVYAGQYSTSYNAPTAPVYIVNGAGGNREGFSGFADVQPPWSAKRIPQWGYGRLAVTDAHHLTWEWYTSADNQLQDSFTISK